MATIADIDGAIATALDAMGATRMDSDYGDLTDRVTAGATRYQIRASVVEHPAVNSSDFREIGRVEIWIHHALADPADERAWTLNGTPPGWRGVCSTILPASWWVALAGVDELWGGGLGTAPEPAVVTDEPERDGNIFSASITCAVIISPT